MSVFNFNNFYCIQLMDYLQECVLYVIVWHREKMLTVSLDGSATFRD